MTYFMIMGGLLALIGLAAIGAAQDIGLLIFGYGLFGFGALFALFLVKRHFDLKDGSGRP
jgi:hypothetical protein